MSTAFDDFHKQALAETLNFIGETVIYEAKQLQAVVSNISFEQELADGGIKFVSGAVAICQKCDFDSLPVVGAGMLYKGRRFRIMKVEDDVSSYEITLATDTR